MGRADLLEKLEIRILSEEERLLTTALESSIGILRGVKDSEKLAEQFTGEISRRSTSFKSLGSKKKVKGRCFGCSTQQLARRPSRRQGGITLAPREFATAMR